MADLGRQAPDRPRRGAGGAATRTAGARTRPLRSRWSAASATQKRYLIAVATVAAAGRTASSRTVADELRRTTKQLSSVRDDLLKQGTLTVEDGELRFTIPGMGAYVLAATAP